MSLLVTERTGDADRRSPLFRLMRPRPLFALLFFVALALALNWYYLGGGFHGDDFIFLNMFEEVPRPYVAWKGPWSIFHIPAFENLWWIDPDVSGAFFRPLPGYLIEGSIRFLGMNAFPLHLLSLLLFGITSFLFYLFLSELTGSRPLALTAAILYLGCEDHSMALGWIATMTDIFCVFFINLALLFHLRWLRRRKRRFIAGVVLALLFALLSKETASIAPVVLAATTFFFPRGSAGGRFEFSREALFKRIRDFVVDPASWLPSLIILSLYLGLYFGLGLGTGMNNLMYVNPFTRPLDYLSHLAWHLPVVWLAALSPVYPSLSIFLPQSLPVLTFAGVILFSFFLIALYRWREDPLILWSLSLFLLALLPQMGTDASERLLYYPYLFAALLLARLILALPFFVRRLGAGDSGLPAAKEGSRTSGNAQNATAPVRSEWIARNFARFLLFSAILPGLALSAVLPFSYRPSLQQPERESLTALPYVRDATREIIMLNASSPFITFYPGDILTHHLGRRIDAHVLSACSAAVTLERTGPSSFILRADRKGWLDNMFARIARSRSRLRQGAVYRKRLFSATLLELTADQRDVLAVEFRMQRPFDNPELLFLRWKEGAFHPLALSDLPLRRRILLEDTSDIFKHMF